VRLIDDQGRQAGIVPFDEALRAAYEHGLDLVEVAPNAQPPVCRMLDYGKFVYQQAKKERDARKARRTRKGGEVREIQLRPKTGEHDIAFRLRAARRFLERGSKVKVRVRFRGREITHPEVARKLLGRVAGDLSDVSQIEKYPAMEGRSMLMILSPISKS
jgi:translation initiation factor IF-3